MTAFSPIQAATDARQGCFLFDLLHLDGVDVAKAPVLERKQQLARLFAGAPPALQNTYLLAVAYQLHGAHRAWAKAVALRKLTNIERPPLVHGVSPRPLRPS